MIRAVEPWASEADRRSAETAWIATVDAADRSTWRTLDEISDDPPDELLLGMLEPHGPTLAYAAPGVGKGTTGAWMIVALQELGLKVAIFDAERREREWARRVSGLGGDRRSVAYMTPLDLRLNLRGKPLWDAAEGIAEMVSAAGSHFLIIDSVLPAIGVGEDRLKSDAQAPFLYVQALDALGIPSLSFGHPPKGNPEGDPFGSMAWVAAMRMTWLGTKAESEGHAIRWRPRKRNERGALAGVLLTVTYAADGRPNGVVRADDDESTRERIFVMLKAEARGVGDMADELLEEVEVVTTELRERTKERLSRQLRRMAKDGWVIRPDRSGRDAKWSLNWERRVRK